MRFRLRTLLIVVLPVMAGMAAGYCLLPPDNKPVPGVEDTHRWAIIYGGAGGLALRMILRPATAIMHD